MFLHRIYARLKRDLNVLRGKEVLYRKQIDRSFITIGNRRASWSVSPDSLSESSVVYSVGVGEDISFDLELIQRFGVCVHAFDPTPRSIEWIRSRSLPEKFIFHPYGVADRDGMCKFNPPTDSRYVSHTVVERKTPWPSIEVPVHRVETILRSLNHSRIDLLKMDIEGAEYGVLDDIISSGVAVNQLLVEFHHRWPEIGVEKTKIAVQRLNQAGFAIFNISPSGEEYGFLKTPPAHSLG